MSAAPKRTFSGTFREAFAKANELRPRDFKTVFRQVRGLRPRDIVELFRETFHDIITSRQEAAIAIVLIGVVPLGQPTYVAYRLARHFQIKAAANDNKPPAPEYKSVPPGPPEPK